VSSVDYVSYLAIGCTLDITFISGHSCAALHQAQTVIRFQANGPYRTKNLYENYSFFVLFVQPMNDML